MLDAEHAKEYDGKLLSLKVWVNGAKSAKKLKGMSLMGDKSRPLNEIKTALSNVLRVKTLTKVLCSSSTPLIPKSSSSETSVKQIYLKLLMWPC